VLNFIPLSVSSGESKLLASAWQLKNVRQFLVGS